MFALFYLRAIGPHHDLLGDDDDVGHTSPPLHDQSAEIGNTQNQLNSTNRSLDTLKNERSSVEEALANQASQLSALQTQLSSAKAAYETETKLLSTLRERHSSQIAEMQKTREELIRAESDLSAVRVEKSEVEGAFMRDKEDVRELHRKMAEIGQQAEVLKTEVEKAKKDAKQQKGLLAIAKKQLSSKETEKAKAEKELEEANLELVSITKEKDDIESHIATLAAAPPVRAMSSDSLAFAAGHTLPVSPDPSSPTGSIATGKSNNPFDRLSKTPGTPRSPSPFLPFNTSSIPTPSTQDAPGVEGAHEAFDPFGFAEAEPAETKSQAPKDILATFDATEAASRTSTPKPTPVDIFAANGPQTVFSPATTEGESDHFVTPPSTATFERSQTSSPAPQNAVVSPATKFPALGDVASHFPDIQAEDAKASHATVPAVGKEHNEIDLGSQLKELDIEESDSDSEDEVPLAELAKKGQDHLTPSSAALAAEQEPSFDDIFGAIPQATSDNSAPQVQSISSPTTVNEPVAKPFTASPIAPKVEPPTVAGVNAFDEAMGAIPSTSSPVTQAFTFDSAFEDNFDFASAAEKSFPAPPGAAPNGNKHSDFDSIFSTPVKNNTAVHPAETPFSTSANGHAIEHSPRAASPKPTFDEAFSGFDSGPALELDNSFSSPGSTRTNATPAQAAFPGSPGSRTVSPTPPRIAASQPVSPSVGRPKSPPPRVSSPKPRPSTSSSNKETQDKPKEPPTRRSKLSVCHQTYLAMLDSC